MRNTDLIIATAIFAVLFVIFLVSTFKEFDASTTKDRR
jgi:hypothetical protein